MSDNLPAPAPDDSGEFILYQTEDGETRIDVRMEQSSPSATASAPIAARSFVSGRPSDCGSI